MAGIIIYGTPATNAVRVSVCGADEKDRVIELTRMWVKDRTPQNTESFFISRSLGLLKKLTEKDIIISYSDLGEGHVGIIYRASNFLRAGVSVTTSDWVLEGVHNQTID